MTRSRLTRRQLLVAAGPAVAAVPLIGLAGASVAQGSDGHDHAHEGTEDGTFGHASMIGDEVPAVGGPDDLNALLYPPPALPHQPGRVRDYEITAFDTDVEIFPGISFPAWTL